MYLPTEPLKTPQHYSQLRGMQRGGETPGEGETPRGQTTSIVSEEESASEWEIDRQKVAQ